MTRRAHSLAAAALCAALAAGAAPALADPEPWLPTRRQAWIKTSVTEVKPGTFVDVTFGEDNTNDSGIHEYRYGDGTGFVSDIPGTFCVPIAQRRMYSRKKAYRRPGTYKLQLLFTSRCEENALFKRSISAEATIKVLPGKSPGNGPAEPTATIRHIEVDHNLVAKMEARVGDEDGYIHKVVIKWGDKKESVIHLPLSKCKDPGTVWPSSKAEDQPNNVRYPTHKYAGRGFYTVTITAYSGGCNGKDVQQKTGQWQFTV